MLHGTHAMKRLMRSAVGLLPAAGRLARLRRDPAAGPDLGHRRRTTSCPAGAVGRGHQGRRPAGGRGQGGRRHATKRDITDEPSRRTSTTSSIRWEQGPARGQPSSGAAPRSPRDFGDAGRRAPRPGRGPRQPGGGAATSAAASAEAMRIWEQLAAGPKPYAPALAQLGYVAWQRRRPGPGRDPVQPRRSRPTSSSGRSSARLNLAQILRDKARRASSAEEQSRYNREAHRPPAHGAGRRRQQPAGLRHPLLLLLRPRTCCEMARLVGTQAIRRAEEIATGKFVGRAGRHRRRRRAAARPPRARQGARRTRRPRRRPRRRRRPPTPRAPATPRR